MADDPVRDLIESLATDDAILEETAQTLRATVPGYEGVPTESLKDSARRNRSLSVRTLLDGRAPSADQIDEAVTLTEERMSQGVSIGSVLAGFRVSMSVILRHLLETAPRYGVPAEATLSFSTLLWALGDAFTTRSVIAYRDRAVAQAVVDSARRAQWIRSTVVSGLEPTQLVTGAAAYGVPRDVSVRALCIDVGPEAGVDPAGRLQDWAELAGARALVAPRGAGAVGILVGDLGPAAGPDGARVALGPPVALEDLPGSFEVATRVLESARRVGFGGVVDVERLSWRMGIIASPEATSMLHSRYLAPLRGEGEFGELVVESLRAYLGHRMSIPRAAASIPVHVNTLRYRLRRFRDLTGADLHDLDTLVEVSWALAADAGVTGSTVRA